MKKLLALLLTAALLCSMLAACGTKTEEGTETTASTDANVTYDLEGAAAYVQSLYKEDLTVTAVDFNVVSQVMIAGVTYQIDWSVDTDKVTVGAPANGIVTVNVNEKSPEQQFAILKSSKDKYYLYSISAAKFVKKKLPYKVRQFSKQNIKN